MSHSVVIKAVEVRDAEALAAACQRCGLEAPKEGLHRLFDRTQRQGHAVKLKNWNYPVIFDLQTGEALYDNYNGDWGNELELDRLIQGYTAEVVSSRARASGYSNITENQMADGTLQLVCADYS